MHNSTNSILSILQNSKSRFYLLLSLSLLFLSLSNCDPKEVNLQEYLSSANHPDKISFNHKRFSDSLQQISKETQLTEIEMNYDAISELPQEWGELNKLKKLSLYGNALTDLPASFHNLINLEILLLGMNPLEQIPTSLRGLPNLRILSLDETKLKLTLEDVNILASLPNLEILDLSENPKLLQVPDNVSKLNSIKSILLKKNKLSEEERRKIFTALPNVSLSK